MPAPSVTELEARLEAARASPTEPERLVDALVALAWELRSTDVPRANALATEARQLAIDSDYILGQARAARTLGMCVIDIDGVREIFTLAQEAKRLFDQTDDYAGRAGARDFLASLYEHVGDLAAGMEMALDALSIAREIGDPVRQGYALSSVGGLLAASGDIDTSIARLHEAKALFESVNDDAGVGAICSRLAKVLQTAGRSEAAAKCAQMCLETGDKLQAHFLRWTALMVMAQLEEDRGNLEEAERLYRDALATLSSETDRAVIGPQTQVALAKLFMKRKDFGDAERELTEVLALVGGESVSITIETAAHEAMSELCEAIGDLARTVKHLRKAQELRAVVAQQDARTKLAQVEARAVMEAVKKDAEIHKLRYVELHGMQTQLVEAEKMALLGTLAAGTAHELNTPLGVLRSNAELSATAAGRLAELVSDEALGARAEKLANVLDSCRQSSDEAVERISAIAESFRRFAQLDYAELRSFDVREGLEAAMALLEPTISTGIQLQRRFQEVPPIRGWPREVNHAFMTVLKNAVQAIDGEGVVTVQTTAANDEVLVSVADNGCGMTEEQAANLFDVTWSDEGQRTKMRLGLSAAYSTMKRHGGAMEVDTRLGEGTTVTFRFDQRAHPTGSGPVQRVRA